MTDRTKYLAIHALMFMQWVKQGRLGKMGHLAEIRIKAHDLAGK